MPFDRYLVNHSSQVIHQIPIDERCNTDALEERVEVKEEHALKLVEEHQYRRCSWCWARRTED